ICFWSIQMALCRRYQPISATFPVYFPVNRESRDAGDRRLSPAAFHWFMQSKPSVGAIQLREKILVAPLERIPPETFGETPSALKMWSMWALCFLRLDFSVNEPPPLPWHCEAAHSRTAADRSRNDACGQIGAFVFAGSDGLAPLCAPAGVSGGLECTLDRAADMSHVRLVLRNEFSASQGGQISRVVFPLSMRWHNCTGNAGADRRQARAMPTVVKDQVWLVVSRHDAPGNNFEPPLWI